MTITSVTQTQYATTSSSNTGTKDTSTYDEVAKKKEPSRYEMLLNKNYDNMSEAERRELSYYNAMRPVKYLDEAGNEALNKALEGKTDAEKFSIKGMLELEFMTSVKSNAQGGLDRQKFDSIDTSKDATVSRFEKFLDDYRKGGQGVDTLGIAGVVGKFLDIYTNSTSTKDIKNQENSVVDKFLEDLYKKESIDFKSTLISDEIKNKVNEYAQMLMDESGDSPKTELETSKLLNQFKNELLQEYKESIKTSNSDALSAEQQAIIKVLMDENTKEGSALEQLLSQTTSASTSVTKTEATGKMAETEEKYKDVYSPMPSSYSKERSELPINIIKEKYPNYLSAQEAVAKYAVKDLRQLT